MIPQPLATDLVRVKLRLSPKRSVSIWARPLRDRGDGRRLFLKVNDQGEVPSSFNRRTNVVTETKEIFVASAAEVLSEVPAFMSLKYGELTTDSKED